jgi:hypothetical protein
MKPISNQTRGVIQSLTNNLQNELKKLSSIKLSIDEFKLLSYLEDNIKEIESAIKGIRFQISDVHFEEQKEMEEDVKHIEFGGVSLSDLTIIKKEEEVA